MIKVFSFLLICAVTACTSFPPPSTGTITQLKFEDECFDLDKGKIQQSVSFNARCIDTNWDFVFTYNSEKNPHAMLFLNPLADIKVAYWDKSYASISLSDALTANFTSKFVDQPIETAIIQTSKNSYFKIHILQQNRENEVTFEWEKLK